MVRLDRLGFLGALRPRTRRIVRAGLEQPVPPAPLHHWFATDRARLVEQLRALLRLAVLAHVGAVLALRVAGAGDEGAVTPCPLDQLPLPTLRALLAGRLGRRGSVLLYVLALRVA